MLTVETQIQLGLKPQWHPYLFLIFFATLCEYNVHRFITVLTHKEALNSPKHKWVKDHLIGFYVLVFASVAGFLISSLLAKKEVLFTLAPIAVLTLFYSIPVYGNKKSIFRLREIPYLKIFIISFTWSATTILLPVIQTGQHFDPNHIILMLIERFVFVFGITLPFDIRDMADDRIANTRTLALLLGENNATKLASGSLIVFSTIAVMHYVQLDQHLVATAMLVSGLSTLLFLHWKAIKHLPLYHYAILDGTMLFQGILVLGSSYLN